MVIMTVEMLLEAFDRFPVPQKILAKRLSSRMKNLFHLSLSIFQIIVAIYLALLKKGVRNDAIRETVVGCDMRARVCLCVQC